MRSAIIPTLVLASFISMHVHAETKPAPEAPTQEQTARVKQTHAVTTPDINSLRPNNAPLNTGIATPLDGTPSFAREPDTAAPSTPQTAPTTGAASPTSGIVCPPELRSLVAVDDPNSHGWSVGGPEQTALLKGARLYAGPLSEKTMERYNELTAIPIMNRERGEFQQVWSFDTSLLAAGVMLVCDYSGNNHFLMRALPSGTKECRETDAVERADVTPTTVTCQ
jgi:hypothetical protein